MSRFDTVNCSFCAEKVRHSACFTAPAVPPLNIMSGDRIGSTGDGDAQTDLMRAAISRAITTLPASLPAMMDCEAAAAPPVPSESAASMTAIPGPMQLAAQFSSFAGRSSGMLVSSTALSNPSSWDSSSAARTYKPSVDNAHRRRAQLMTTLKQQLSAHDNESALYDAIHFLGTLMPAHKRPRTEDALMDSDAQPRTSGACNDASMDASDPRQRQRRSSIKPAEDDSDGLQENVQISGVHLRPHRERRNRSQ